MPARAPLHLSPRVDRVLAAAGVDREPATRRPSAGQVVLATVLALAGSLTVGALLVALGTHFFPSTRGFAHFRPLDYGSLTVVGVLAAGTGWPVVTRLSSTPRRLYFRLAILVTLVLLVPDAWILLRGEPPRAVGVLVAMHLAVALVTYNVVVSVAPAGRRRSSRSWPSPAIWGAHRAMARGARWADAAGRGAVPVPRDATNASLPPDAAYGPDGVAIAVPVDAPAGRVTTVLPAAGLPTTVLPTTVLPTAVLPTAAAVTPGTAGHAFGASVVPLRPKAAPPVGRAAGGGGERIDPGGPTGPVPAARRPEADVRTRIAGTSPFLRAGAGRLDKAVGPAPDPGSSARRTGRRSPGERPGASVARPPATVAEPRSAIRLLPPQHAAGADPAAVPGHPELGVEGAAGKGLGIAPPLGRHARHAPDGGDADGGETDGGETDGGETDGGTGGRPASTGWWRRPQRGRHAARS